MSYPGGKAGAGVYQAIINQMPPHDHYVEPFLGGGAILKHKRPATSTIAIDADNAVWRGFPKDAVPNLRLDCCDGIEWMKCRLTWKPNTLVYCDPPYLLSSRKGQRPIYRCELTDADHERLLRVVRALPCMVMLSGYASELYMRALHDWRLVTFSAITRSGKIATEHLWCNFPAPAALHDYRYLGGDYRERERIKRKVTRWSDRFAALDPLERQAILSELLAEAAFRDFIARPGDVILPADPAVSDRATVIIGAKARTEPQLPGFAA